MPTPPRCRATRSTASPRPSRTPGWTRASAATSATRCPAPSPPPSGEALEAHAGQLLRHLPELRGDGGILRAAVGGDARRSAPQLAEAVRPEVLAAAHVLGG